MLLMQPKFYPKLFLQEPTEMQNLNKKLSTSYAKRNW